MENPHLATAARVDEIGHGLGIHSHWEFKIAEAYQLYDSLRGLLSFMRDASSAVTVLPVGRTTICSYTQRTRGLTGLNDSDQTDFLHYQTTCSGGASLIQWDVATGEVGSERIGTTDIRGWTH